MTLGQKKNIHVIELFSNRSCPPVSQTAGEVLKHDTMASYTKIFIKVFMPVASVSNESRHKFNEAFTDTGVC